MQSKLTKIGNYFSEVYDSFKKAVLDEYELRYGFSAAALSSPAAVSMLF